MNNIQDIIQLCHERHAVRDALRQRKTVVTLALHKPLPYQIKVHCARRNPITLEELENADISFMPIGHAPDNDHAPQDFDGHRFKRQQKLGCWSMRQWRESWGIQIYTGIPSQREGALWHDFEIKYDAICAAPDAITTCLETLLNLTANPLLTITKSGGLRFSCRIQNYLHPNTDKAKYHIYKHKPTKDKPNHRAIYMVVRGDEGYSRWDMRYEILLGNLLEPPIISKEVVFAPIHQLRATLHEPEPSQQDIIKTTDVNLPAFSSTIAQQDAEVADNKTAPAVLLTGDPEDISGGLFLLRVGIGRTYIYGIDMALRLGGEFSCSYETPSYAMVGELRLSGSTEYQSGSDSLFFRSYMIGGRYFFNKQNISPYIGGGLARFYIDYKKNVKEYREYCVRRSDSAFEAVLAALTLDPDFVSCVKTDWKWFDTYEQELGSGFGMYGVVGIEFLRFTRSRLNLELRVDRPFFTLPSIDVMPISLGITYSLGF